MSGREFIALGTSSQVPTRDRSHNAYLLRWDQECFLFDPGEGVQRQLTYAGVAAGSIGHICITHFHGDHCLGLAGIAQRLSVEHCDHPVHIYYPESGQAYMDRLCEAAIYKQDVKFVSRPIEQTESGMIELFRTDEYTLSAHHLDHSVPTVGFRLEEPDRRHFVPEKLVSAGVEGRMVGKLLRKGTIRGSSGVVNLGDVSARRPGMVFAFVMDTRPCTGAAALARNADLLVMEATYTSEHKELADRYFHSTAADAASAAAGAGVRQLALTHFSQRYRNADQHLEDAKNIFGDVVVLNDLDRIKIPRRDPVQ